MTATHILHFRNMLKECVLEAIRRTNNMIHDVEEDGEHVRYVVAVDSINLELRELWSEITTGDPDPSDRLPREVAMYFDEQRDQLLYLTKLVDGEVCVRRVCAPD